MGLDAVEMVLRTEELFVINIGDDEAASVRTVGDFYNLICEKLDVPLLQNPVTPANLPVVTEKEKVFLFLQKQTPLPAPPEVLPWSPQSVWDSLSSISCVLSPVKSCITLASLKTFGLIEVASRSKALCQITGNSAVETATHDEGDNSKKDYRSDKTCSCRPNHDSPTNYSAFKELASNEGEE
jgi:hypothetical protein